MIWIIYLFVVFGGLIFFHEFGHFIVARMLGIGVKTFSLGFGPRLAGFKMGNTDYRLSAVPLGGYVNLAGEERDMDLDSGFRSNQLFMNRPPWHRMMVVAAGPIFNFILAWLIFWGIILSQGQMGLKAEVGNLQPNGPAEIAGLKPGDEVLAIDGHDITFFHDLSEIIQASENEKLDFKINRNGTLLNLEVKPRIQENTNLFGEKIRVPMVGIMASDKTTTVQLDGMQSFYAASEQTWNVISLIGESIVKMIERVVPIDSIGGPIMIAQAIKQQSERGILHILQLTAFISINLGLLNLLPIPVLDGGHIIFFGLEIVLRKPLDEKLQAAATRVGLFLLLCLMALAIFNDIVRTWVAK
jgi:regulator of sigma E protease